MKSYKEQHTKEERKVECEKMNKKYENRICVIVERSKSCNSTIGEIDKRKYLVSYDMHLSSFLIVLRKRISLGNEQALLIFVKDTHLLTSTLTMAQIYNEHKDEDGFLYMTYCGENTFG
jgi:GABA(A) receptor-associated protein